MNVLLVSFLVVLVEVYSYDYLMRYFCNEKKSAEVISRILRIVVLAIIFTASVNLLDQYAVLKIIVNICVLSIYQIVFYKQSWFRGLLMIALASIVFYGCDLAIYSALRPFFNGEKEALLNQEWWSLSLTYFAKLIQLSAVILLCKLYNRKQTEKYVGKQEGFMIFISVAIMIIIFAYYTQNVDGLPVYLIIGILSLYFIFIIAIQNAGEKEWKLRKMEEMQKDLKNQVMLFHSQKEMYDRQSKKLHDYKNQLLTIRELLMQQSKESALEYLDQLTGSIAHELDYVDCKNAMINAVFNMKYCIAKEQGIHFQMQISDLHGVKLNQEDIVVIIGNILDNAIEACILDKGNGGVQIKMVLEDGNFIFSTQNLVSAQLSWKDGLPRTTKPESDQHGIGLRTVKMVVEKNGGTFAIQEKKNQLKVVVMIPVND